MKHLSDCCGKEVMFDIDSETRYVCSECLLPCEIDMLYSMYAEENEQFVKRCGKWNDNIKDGLK